MLHLISLQYTIANKELDIKTRTKVLRKSKVLSHSEKVLNRFVFNQKGYLKKNIFKHKSDFHNIQGQT